MLISTLSSAHIVDMKYPQGIGSPIFVIEKQRKDYKKVWWKVSKSFWRR